MTYAQWNQTVRTKLQSSLNLHHALPAAEDIDTVRQLSDYGVDSLMAVELRSWLSRDFSADITVFDILGGASIAMIGQLARVDLQRPASSVLLTFRGSG
ncbi:Lovastatin diketide synthase LovF [Apiospora kogelbergensis]|uniref:Lovastatin diketide synthase LovF n=1 Tax=Apiospora kogelbergensis TaxID=1337665 RepID=A0AAW0Q7U4_9PEZI